MFKKTGYFTVLIWIFSDTSFAVAFNESGVCEQPWRKLHQSCIQFLDLKKTWQDARVSCLSMNSDLLSIVSEREVEKIRTLLYEPENDGILKWWIGLYKEDNIWKWLYNNDSYAGIPDWAPDVQWNTTHHVEQCGLLEYQTSLRNRNCNVPHHYICERNKTTYSTTQTHLTGTTPVSTVHLSSTPSTTFAVPTPDTRTPPTKSTINPGVTSTRTTTTLLSSAINTKTTRQTTGNTTQVPDQSTVTRTTRAEISSSFSTDKVITGISSESTAVHETDKYTTKNQNDSTETSTASLISKYTSDMTNGPSTDHQTTKEPTESTRTNTHDYTTTSFTTEQTTQFLNSSTFTSEQTSTSSSFTTEQTTQISTQPQVNEQDKFRGCFSINYEKSCPPVKAFGFSWPRSSAGTMVTVSCRTGYAQWNCSENPTCWKGEPDVKQCTSESVQELTSQMDEFLSNTSNIEVALKFTENLAASIDTEMSEQDIFQTTTKLLSAVSSAKPNDSSGAKSIIQNVVTFGSGLVGKTETWTAMNTESQRSIASSLLTSMESVTNKMIQSFDEPTVETIQQENIVIQLQVVDVDQNGSKSNETSFQSDDSLFTIPQENLKRFTTGGMARLVFINYNFVDKYLAPTDNLANDNSERMIISKLLSASISEKPVNEPLIEPVVFTMKTQQNKKDQNITQLCSFWNFSLGYNGAWSQEGCSLIEGNDTHVTCQCNHLTNFAILLDVHSTKVSAVHSIVLSYITYVGIIISIICLLLSWITFVCLSIRCVRGSRSSYGYGEGKEYYGNSSSYSGSSASSRSIQGERNSIHKNLVFCLFIAEVLFLFGIERTDNKVACAVIAGFLHYFFLSSFAWMLAEGIHIVFMLVQVFDAARSRLKYYYVIGYGAPLLIIAISSLVYYEGYGTEKYCWLTTDRMFIWSFAGPLIFILVVNLIIQIYAMYAVYKHSEYVFTKEKSKIGNIKAWIQGALAMEVLLGLTWVFGYFYISEEAIPIAYFFTIFNSLQGLFIFVFHCLLNKKVRKAYSRFIDYPGRFTSSSSQSPNTYRQNGTSPTSLSSSSYHKNATRKHSKFLDLTKDRRPSAMSTTSA